MSGSDPSSSGLIQQRPFVLFWLARLASSMGYQMFALVIGWQVYQLTNSALDLGLVGLIQFVPAVVLTLLIGHAADRYDRRSIIRAAQSVNALAALIITVAGAVAAWLGAVTSVLIGGIGSLAIAATWMLMFPSLRRLDRFEPADNREART